MKVKRHKFTKPVGAVLIVLTLITGFYFIQTLFSPDYVEKRVINGEYVQAGHLDYSAELKPNLIYERMNINSDNTLYSALLKRMELIYSYSFSPTPEEIRGNYKITLLLTPVKGGWEKEIGAYLGNFSGSNFKVSIPLDWEKTNFMWKEIENETKYDFGDPNLKVVADLSLEGKFLGQELKEKFTHSANIAYGKIISLSEPDKNKKGTLYSNLTLVNTMSFFGLPVEVKNARLIFGVQFVALVFLLGTFIAINRSNIAEYLSKRERKSFERRFRNRIVNTLELPEYSDVVRVSNLKDLAKLSYELEKPILKSEGRFAVLDGERFYVYDNDNIIINRK